MKIIHFITSIDRSSGGTAMYMQLLAKELGKIVELHVVTHNSANPLKMENCTVHFIKGDTYGRGMKRDWLNVLNEVRPDVVHVNCCWMPEIALAQRLAQKAGYKVALTPHGMLEPWILKRHYLTKKLPALLLFQKRAVRTADVIHATAESEKQNLLKLGYNKNIVVVPNGVDVDAIEMKRSWERTGNVLFLSRVHPKKGINFLIEAAATMPDCGLKFIIAGESFGNYVEELKQMAKDKGVDAMFDFIGGVYGNKKWELFRNADLFVLPTHSENFGIVVAEALASGTPVLTTKGTPWQDLETYGCGWWTEVGTRPTVEALRNFLTKSESELEYMGRKGRKLVEDKFSARKMAEDLAGVYKSL